MTIEDFRHHLLGSGQSADLITNVSVLFRKSRTIADSTPLHSVAEPQSSTFCLEVWERFLGGSPRAGSTC